MSGHHQPVAVETLSGAGGELEVHQVVAGLLGGDLPVEMVQVAGPVSPDHLLGPLHPEVHLHTDLASSLSERHQSPGGDAGRWLAG